MAAPAGEGVRGRGSICVGAAGQHLGQADLELPDQGIVNRVAEGEAVLLGAQHPAHLELGGIQLLGLDEIQQGGFVAGNQLDPA